MKTCFNCKYFSGDKNGNWLKYNCGKTGLSIKIELSSNDSNYCSTVRKFWEPKVPEQPKIKDSQIEELIRQQKITNKLLSKLVEPKRI